MENKLTNEEIARVFAMYCPSNDKIFINPGTGISYYGTLYQLSSMRGFMHEYRLRLTPLSAITNGHACICARLNGHVYELDKPVLLERGHELIAKLTYSIHCAYPIYTQLIVWSYAVPLFFGINHWANGKTAIELNIAVDKTKIKP